ncbi:MAG: formylglycine-generating enzyme family protein [Melioribacteraceae bacterium]
MNSTKKNIFLLFTLLLCSQVYGQKQNLPGGEMSLIKGGKYTPLYGSAKNGIEIKVAPFYIDKYPVTNARFLEFLKLNPKWKRSNVKKIFADRNYLSHWKSDLELGGSVDPNSPVTNVSWFAAKAYCEFYGKRLPTVAEWEFVAKAGSDQRDGSKNPGYLKQILDWYSKPSTGKMPAVGLSEKNYWGVYDMHGLVWEWTSDFFNSLVTGESRGDSGLERNLFCGSGSVNASDFKNYPAFMRFAFRSSLKANYTTGNLGFRCVKK